MNNLESVIASPEFKNDLTSLNSAIAKALTDAGEDIAINGNVCYGNLQIDFHKGELSQLMEPKRRALVLMAQRSKCFVEVGVAGGHAILLALHANPKLKCIGIDLAQRLRPSWPPVDVFVPATFAWFRKNYPDRTIMITSDAISGLKQIATEPPFGNVDLLHLDGDKRTRFDELNAIWPALADTALLLQGDTRNGHVVSDSKRMIKSGMARPVRDADFDAIQGRNFQCLEVGPSLLDSTTKLEDLYDRNILFCVAHQDDEVLFAGGLLNALRGKAKVTVASFFRPGPRRPDTDTRTLAMKKVCDHVGAEYVQYPFGMESNYRPLWRHTTLANEPENIVGIARAPASKHPLYALLYGTALAAMKQFRSDVVITHNSVGEYGHRQHIMLHHAVLDAANRAEVDKVLTFGFAQNLPGLTVNYDISQKQILFDYYLPQWDGIQKYGFALEPEVFVNEDLKPPE